MAAYKVELKELPKEIASREEPPVIPAVPVEPPEPPVTTTALMTIEQPPEKRGFWASLVYLFFRIAHFVAWPFKWLVRTIRSINASTWLVIACAVLIAGTQLTLIWANTIGLYLNVVTLAILIGLSLWRADFRKLGISLAVLPVAQMVSSTIITSDAFRTASVFYGALLLLTLMYRYMFTLDEPVVLSRLGLKGYAIWIPIALIVGEITGGLGYAFLRNHFPYQDISLPIVATAAVVFAIAEEMFIRGLIQPHAEKLVNKYAAAALAAVVYSVLAISHTTMLTVGPAVIMGIVLAAIYSVKHNIVISIMVNALTKLTYIGLAATFILR